MFEGRRHFPHVILRMWTFDQLQVIRRVIRRVTCGHLSAAADSKASPRNPVMCILLLLENIASLDWILNCKFRPLNSQPLDVQSQSNEMINWSSYCFVWSLIFQSEFGWHPNSSSVNHRNYGASSIALFHDYMSGRKYRVYVIQKHSIWLVSELDPLHGEEGSGHGYIRVVPG